MSQLNPWDKSQLKAEENDQKRVASRVHPLGAALPELQLESSYVWDCSRTTVLGVTTWWERSPESFGNPLLDLYAWSSNDCLTVEGRTFCPGVSCFWPDSRPNRKGKRWSVKIAAVATEHVGRVLHLCPALMVRLYNGEKMFALPHEVEL